MPARTLRVGLAGIAALYWPVCIAEGIRSRRDAQLVSFATLGASDSEIEDNLGMRPGTFERRFGLQRYDDVETMLEAETLDAVALCTRHTRHAFWVERIARRGADIFVAKTFTTTMADADRICASEVRHHVRVAVGPSARYLPWFAAARRTLEAGLIGTPFSLRIGHHHGRIDVFGPRDFYRDAPEGGPELSLGWYVVDLALWLMQKPVTRVSAEYGTFTSPDSPFMDCGRILLGFDGGAAASCDMYFCNRFEFPRWEMEIVGEKGAILLRQPLLAKGPRETSVTLTTARGVRALALPARSPHWELFWIDDFRRRGPPSVTAEYAREVTRICIAAREAARQGKTVSLRPA